MLNDYPDVLTVEMVADALGVCKASIYRLIKENTIGYRRVGRKYIIPKVCVNDYLNSARYMVSKMQ